ncbi:MAG TPA: MBOAT family O-acyltransferase [Bacteroidia bacterium]|jgi:alginate O-acetyltransferase complex protein AlgI|nr:MBOAT family O-acyltransferase [Bacteroidia bacterium]
MLFNSLQFLVFFAFVVSLYYALPHRSRWFLLLLASCYFYMVFVPEYVLILFGVILIDYLAAFLIAGTQGFKRKLSLGLSLAANIGILCYFKYYNFFLDNISLLLNSFHVSNPLPYIYVVLPIGLSFHTFQAMSYTIEVYRGNQQPEKHFGIYALYVLFFPQLVAGPIERPQNLLPQFKKEQIYSSLNLRSGLILMAWGFFKKVVIADRLAVVVDDCYWDPGSHSTGDLWITVLFYSIQIYCDFSGYSDIAIGAAKTMGINLMENFKNPYLSTSLTEFWRRWHISLSTWFRDYVYIPMGGNRMGLKKMCFAILLVFFLSGLWHGAKYTFIVWALIHAFFLILEHILKTKNSDPGNFLSRLLKILYTLLVTGIAWIFFRAQNIGDAFFIINRLFTLNTPHWNELAMNTNELVFSFMLIAVLLSLEKPIKKFTPKSSFTYYSALFTLILICYFFGIFNSRQFIYFQF